MEERILESKIRKIANLKGLVLTATDLYEICKNCDKAYPGETATRMIAEAIEYYFDINTRVCWLYF